MILKNMKFLQMVQVGNVYNSIQRCNYMYNESKLFILNATHKIHDMYVQWILVITLTVYYVISVITLETQNTKPFPI